MMDRTHRRQHPVDTRRDEALLDFGAAERAGPTALNTREEPRAAGERISATV